MKKLLLISILILSFLLRVYRIANYPSLNADEAALAYNAYSLLLTGRDEHGNVLPINLESFGDYKPSLYSYLLVPIIAIFGLDDFWIRFPSVLFGAIGVLGIYLLTKKLFQFQTSNFKFQIEEIAAFLLAISPWHIHFSRGAWEVNIATTMLILGVWAFLSNRLMVGVLSFVLSMYTYQATRVVAPVLFVSLYLACYGLRSIWAKRTFLVFGFMLLLLIPLFLSILTSNAASRFSGVSWLADLGPENRANELRGQHEDWNSKISRVLHNRPLEYGLRLLSNWASHYTGNFLFVDGDEITRNKIPETGLLYLTDFIWIVLGIIYILNHKSSIVNRVVLSWLFIAPLASAITFQTPHALRAHNMVIPLTILSSLGIYSFMSYIINLKSYIKIIWHLLFAVYCLLFVFSFFRYLHEYYVHTTKEYPLAVVKGFKEAVDYIKTNGQRYKYVYFTDTYDQPYIQLLYYLAYPPRLFQNNHVLTERDKFNFSTVNEFDKYIFTDTTWSKISDIHDTLIVADGDDIPNVGVHVIKIIYFDNGEPAFKIVSN